MNILDEFVTARDGQGVDFDGRYGDQCVDLFRAWCECLGLAQPPGVAGAADLWDVVSVRDWERIENTPPGVPRPGDVIIWSRAVGPYGHVAVFIEGDARRFTSFDQNWPAGSKCHRQAHDYHGVRGWLRPRVPVPDPLAWLVPYLAEHGIDARDEAGARAALDGLFASRNAGTRA